MSDRPSVLEEAAKAVHGPRAQAYGDPSVNFERIASLWSAYLSHPISARQVAWMMTLHKASRDANRPGRDNLVDSAGYMECAGLLREEF